MDSGGRDREGRELEGLGTGQGRDQGDREVKGNQVGKGSGGRGPGERQQAATVVGGGRVQPMAEPTPHRQVCGVLERENDD